MVVDDGPENRLAFALLGLDPRAVHEVGDPQVVGMRHLVFGPGLVGPTPRLVQAAGLEQSPKRRFADSLFAEHAIVVQQQPEQLDRDVPMLDPVAADDLDRVFVERAEAALVRTGLGQEGIQAPALILAQPQPQRGDAEAADRAVGQLVLACGDPGQDLSGHLVGQRTGGLGDQPVAKHRPVAGRGPCGLRLVFNHHWNLRACWAEGLSAGFAATMPPAVAATKTDRVVDVERDGLRRVA